MLQFVFRAADLEKLQLCSLGWDHVSEGARESRQQVHPELKVVHFDRLTQSWRSGPQPCRGGSRLSHGLLVECCWCVFQPCPSQLPVLVGSQAAAPKTDPHLSAVEQQAVDRFVFSGTSHCFQQTNATSPAANRIHRFGQTREVFVERFLIKASIDEKMIALQERKTKIINGALGKNDGKSQKQLSEDLALIFAD